jgi:hypothetical protein
MMCFSFKHAINEVWRGEARGGRDQTLIHGKEKWLVVEDRWKGGVDILLISTVWAFDLAACILSHILLPGHRMSG